MDIKNIKFAVLSASFVATALVSASSFAQEVGRVISSTPVISQLPVTKQVCNLDAYRNQVCTNQTEVENRTTGYTVVYEYAGQVYSMYTTSQPGQYIALTAALPPPQQAYPQGINNNYVEPYPIYTAPPAYQSYAPAYVGPTYASPSYVAPLVVGGLVARHFLHRPPVIVRGGGYGYSGHHGGGHHGGHGWRR
jgi:hypothetical protein